MNDSRIPPPPQKIFEYLNGNIVGHYIMKKSVAVAIYNHYCDTTIGGIKNHGDEGVWDMGPTLTSSKSSHHLDMERTSQDLFKVDPVKSEKVEKPSRWMPDAVRKYHERRDSADRVPVAGDSPEDYMSPIESRVIIEASTHRVHLLKSNTLTFDSTGSGRPLAAIAANIARYLNVPYVRVDCSQLVSSKWQKCCKEDRSVEESEDRKGSLAQLLSGYVGETIRDMVPKLLKKADYDLDLAERGIVFLDNMDRVGLNSDRGHVPAAVKDALAEIFQIIDGTEVTAPGRPPPPLISDLSRSPSMESGIDVASLPDCEDNPVTIHTSHLFFICFGVNDEVENERRKDSIASKGSMGTSSSSSSGRGTHSGDSDERREVREPRSFSSKKHGDFADSGSFYTDDEDDERFEALHENMMREVKNIPIKKLLGMNDVELTMTSEAMEVIVAQAQMQNAGGDGIRTILEKLLFEVKFLLQTEMQMENRIIKAVEITEEAVLGKAPPNFLENVTSTQSTNTRKVSSGWRKISQTSLNTIREESNGTEWRAKVSTRALMKTAFMTEYEEDVFSGLEL